MTAEGCLVHVASSTTNTNYVLDLYEPLPKGRYRDDKVVPLVVTKMRSSKAETQTWELTPVGDTCCHCTYTSAIVSAIVPILSPTIVTCTGTPLTH